MLKKVFKNELASKKVTMLNVKDKKNELTLNATCRQIYVKLLYLTKSGFQSIVIQPTEIHLPFETLQDKIDHLLEEPESDIDLIPATRSTSFIASRKFSNQDIVQLYKRVLSLIKLGSVKDTDVKNLIKTNKHAKVLAK